MKTKFEFKPKTANRTLITLHVPDALYNRLQKACDKLNITNTRNKGKKPSESSMQELIRQMIDHCLNDVGIPSETENITTESALTQLLKG